jgi:chitodextrinase
MTKKIHLPLVVFVSVLFLIGGFPLAHAQSTVVIPPSTPTGLSASTGAAPSQVNISWGTSTAGTNAVAGYYLYRNGVLIVNSPGFTYYLDDVTTGGVYSYTVASYDVQGNISPQSSPVYVTVVEDTTPPTVPTSVTATTTASSSITITWNPSTDNVGVVGYYIYRNGTKLITTNPIAGPPYMDTGLAPGNYSYAVTAYDASGNVSDRSAIANATIIYDVTPPSVPTGLTISTSSGQINLSWNASTDNVGVTGYNVYRNGALLGTATTPSYQDTGTSPGTTYFYTVAAYDLYGNTSSQSLSQSITTPPPDTTPPSIPQNVVATPLSSSQVSLTWTPSTDNVGVAGYNISNDGTQVGTTAAPPYVDTNLATSTTYTYGVSAYDAAGNTSPQAFVTVTTLSYTPTAPITPPTTTPVYTPTTTPVIATPEPTITTPTPSNPGFVFSTALYYGLRNTTVITLQNFLIQGQYLGVGYNTGFYGSLTQKAVQTFQCDEGIVCSGSPATTGWGSVGPRTRKILNSLY